MSSGKRLEPKQRRADILRAAMELAQRHGYRDITREQIARRAGVSTGLVTNYLGTMNNLRRDIMRHAIAQGVVEIVGQGLAHGDPHARKAPEEMKQRAVAAML